MSEEIESFENLVNKFPNMAEEIQLKLTILPLVSMLLLSKLKDDKKEEQFYKVKFSIETTINALSRCIEELSKDLKTYQK